MVGGRCQRELPSGAEMHILGDRQEHGGLTMSTIKLRLRELLAQREERENRRIRLAEITQTTGIATSTLTALINDQPDKISLQAVAKLCDYFHCSPGDLFHYTAGEAVAEDTLDAREIVDKWHRHYGSDEYPPE